MFSFLFFLLFSLFLSIFSLPKPKDDIPFQWYSIRIEKNGESIPFQVLLAKNDKERGEGLSIFSSLASHQGMLFVFPREGIHRFWMKGMRFPIDILWFDPEGKLCFIKNEAKPKEYPMVYTPECLSRYVLEIPAGLAKQSSFQIGDKIIFSDSLKERIEKK